MIGILPALVALAVPSGPVVTTANGPVRGQAAGAGGVFRGIRFAAPPIGRLRWRPPQPLKRWKTPVAAVAEHAACPQPMYGEWNRSAAQASAEDCLFLDVRTPKLDRAARLPVLVWIHGGGNRGGASRGTVESRITEQGVILVSVQYRLGALGFLSHPALSAEQGASGNYGLMDQQVALRWVHDNIARFGGDPARVTIAGGSAGAQDVGLHLLAPDSRGLFSGAIAQSGTPGFGVAPRSLSHNERLGEMIAAQAGAGANASSADLRALPLAAILAAQERVDVPDLEDDSFIWLQAVVDGRFLSDAPQDALAAGRFARTPLIIGVNAKEFTGLAGRDPAPVVAREFPRTAPQVLAAYLAAPDDPRLGDVAMQLGTDMVFRCPTVAIATALSARGARVWQYQFDYAPGGEVGHGSELRYVFDQGAPGTPPLQRYWTNFVKTGDPNGGGVPAWPAYDASTRPYLSFEAEGPAVRRDLRGQICRNRDVP